MESGVVNTSSDFVMKGKEAVIDCISASLVRTKNRVVPSACAYNLKSAISYGIDILFYYRNICRVDA